MTSAEKALLDAACEHWISGRFNHLILAVIAERKAKEATPSPRTDMPTRPRLDDVCSSCMRTYGKHSANLHRCPGHDGEWMENTFHNSRS